MKTTSTSGSVMAVEQVGTQQVYLMAGNTFSSHDREEWTIDLMVCNNREELKTFLDVCGVKVTGKNGIKTLTTARRMLPGVLTAITSGKEHKAVEISAEGASDRLSNLYNRVLIKMGWEDSVGGAILVVEGAKWRQANKDRLLRERNESLMDLYQMRGRVYSELRGCAKALDFCPEESRPFYEGLLSDTRAKRAAFDMDIERVSADITALESLR